MLWKGRETAVRRRCSLWHISSGRKSSEHIEGSAGNLLSVCQPGQFSSVSVPVCQSNFCPTAQTWWEERRAEKWGWIERYKDRKGKESESRRERIWAKVNQRAERGEKGEPVASHSKRWLTGEYSPLCQQLSGLNFLWLAKDRHSVEPPLDADL